MKWNKVILTILFTVSLVPQSMQGINFTAALQTTTRIVAEAGRGTAKDVIIEMTKIRTQAIAAAAKKTAQTVAAFGAVALSTVGVTSFNDAGSVATKKATQALEKAIIAQKAATVAQATADTAITGVQALQNSTKTAAPVITSTPTTEWTFTIPYPTIEGTKNIVYNTPNFVKNIPSHAKSAAEFVWQNSAMVLWNGAKAHPILSATIGITTLYLAYKATKKIIQADKLAKRIESQNNQRQVDLTDQNWQQQAAGANLDHWWRIFRWPIRFLGRFVS